MSVKDIINEIQTDISDVTKTNLTYTDTTLVPSTNDNGLTYERGKEKKGKKLCTCVLYVDIRNSVELTIKHHSVVMGKVYTAFTKAVLKIARHHNGHTRNIIGDRVMIVFPAENCFKNAIECATSINHIATKLISVLFPNVEFKCGIGIAHGKIKVIKVGIQRNGTESPENKGLVWAGKPANIASRLTDIANKSIPQQYFEVKFNPRNPNYKSPLGDFLFRSLFSKPASHIPNYQYDDFSPYLKSENTLELSVEEFSSQIHDFSGSDVTIFQGRVTSFTKKNKTIKYDPILMTDSVYRGLKAIVPASSLLPYIKDRSEYKINNVEEKIWGLNVTWNI